jgi:hypothetical protein
MDDSIKIIAAAWHLNAALTAVAGLLFIYALKKEPFKLFVHAWESKNRNIELAKALLESKVLSKEIAGLVQATLEHDVFLKYYRIGVGNDLRRAMVALERRFRGKILWRDIRAARFRMDVKDGQLVVQTNTFDRGYFFFARGAAMFLFGIAALMGLFASGGWIPELNMAFGGLGVFLVAMTYVGLGMLLVIVTRPFGAASKIQHLLAGKISGNSAQNGTMILPQRRLNQHNHSRSSVAPRQSMKISRPRIKRP